jgi:hypothetical protein
MREEARSRRSQQAIHKDCGRRLQAQPRCEQRHIMAFISSVFGVWWTSICGKIWIPEMTMAVGGVPRVLLWSYLRDSCSESASFVLGCLNWFRSQYNDACCTGANELQLG